ncbi:MAG: FGGY-family carbohydrate kinase, partial [Pseudoflavonifractor sp.]
DLYYGAMQGVLFNLLQCYEVLSGLNGIPETIKLSGGILRSPVWTQMCADVFGHDMECPDMEQASMSGAAALALELGGVLASSQDFPPPPQTVVRHRPEYYSRYRQAYEEYLFWYKRLLTEN